MRIAPTPLKASWRPPVQNALRHLGYVLFAAIFAVAPGFSKNHSDAPPTLMVRVEAPVADVLKAVEEVAQDQIVHGTYSYEKERILYGAHSASSANVFGKWQGGGTVLYKVAEKVLSPRYFKDSEDIGTISVRYIVTPADANATIVQIDAVFVDARNVHHPSVGNVESSEYAAVQEHIRNIQAKRLQLQEASTAAVPLPSTPAPSGASQPSATVSDPIQSVTVPELKKHVEALRHQVELRVTEQGAQLKSAPFHSAATLESVPAQSEVLIVVVSPYWYGVETDDGHRGWIHHSQLEPLP